MDINVDALYEVKPAYEMHRPFSLNLTVSLSEGKLRTLFGTIWGDIGDEKLNEWLEAEGYELKKKEIV